MRLGERSLGRATCRIRRCTALPKSMASVREVVGLVVSQPHRRQGHATALMQSICMEADRAGSVMMLMPKTFDAGHRMSEGDLALWYERFGFIKTQNEPLLMARAPSSVGKVFKVLQPEEALAA